MAEHQHQAAHAVAVELPYGVAHQGTEGRAIQAGGTAEMLTTAAFRLRLVAVGQRRRDQPADPRRHFGADGAGQQRVGAQRQVRAMLLGSAAGQEDHGAFADATLVIDPAQLIHVHAHAQLLLVAMGRGRSGQPAISAAVVIRAAPSHSFGPMAWLPNQADDSTAAISSNTTSTAARPASR